LSRQTKLEAVAGSATLLTAAITLPEGEDDGEPEAFWKKGVAPLQLLTNDGIYEADVVDVGHLPIDHQTAVVVTLRTDPGLVDDVRAGRITITVGLDELREK
jgi:hypothetical protein